MTATMIKLDNVPTFTGSEGEFYACTVPFEVERLKRMRKAIDTWGDIAARELADFQAEMAEKHNPIWDQYGYDPVDNEAVSLADTERTMCAVLGVAIASTSENFIRLICNRRGIPLIDDEGDSHFGIICANVNKSFGTTVSELPGYQKNQRARFLGNCFKHNDGKTDQRFEKKYKTPEGEVIEYEKENWDEMIDDTGTLLYALCELLSKPNKKITPSASISKRLIRLAKRVSERLFR